VAKKRVFVSFDFDNDRILRDFIVGQAKLPDSPFEIVDTSLKEAAPMATWEDKAKNAIRRSDLVVVMVGPKTHAAPGVLKEVGFARELNRQIVQVIGYRDSHPPSVQGAGPLHPWDWPTLKRLLA
jgi:hypothetical protein